MNELDYIAYFENLARQHTAIQHSDDACHFLVISEYSKAELEDALSKKLRLPALLLDQYMDDLDTTHDNNLDRIEGGFTLLVKCQKGNLIDQRRARDEARQIARSIIKRIKKDLLPGGTLAAKCVRIDGEFKGDPAPFAPASSDGWGYGFSWILPTMVNVDPADWADLG